jgi:transposase
VLAAAEGLSNAQIAARVGVHRNTARTWRARFARRRLDGLVDEPRPGRPRTVTDAQVREVIVKTLHSAPRDAAQWSTRSMAAETGLTQSAVHRIWRAFGLQPHLQRACQPPGAPPLGDNVRDVVGLYLAPPERAVVLSVDECSEVRSPRRAAAIGPATEQQATQDHRHAASSLYGALERMTDTAMRTLPRHRTSAFDSFLRAIDRAVPADLGVHLVLDHTATHTEPPIQRWLQAHPRFVVHCIPTSASWLDLVQRWLFDLTAGRPGYAGPRPACHLHADIHAWTEARNEHQRPFVWTRTAD